MTKLYGLEIYLPGQPTEPWQTFESDTPFGAISEGDFIDGRTLNTAPVPLRSYYVVVRRVTHLFWQAGDTAKHKIMVHTDHGEPGKTPEDMAAEEG